MYNKVLLIGNVVKDPESKTVKSTSVSKFRLAVDDAYKKDSVLYIDVEAWDKQAEFAEKWLKKGKGVAWILGKRTAKRKQRSLSKLKTLDFLMLALQRKRAKIKTRNLPLQKITNPQKQKKFKTMILQMFRFNYEFNS
jgi:hypothetical protein